MIERTIIAFPVTYRKVDTKHDHVIRCLPADKIFYFQISDAQKMDPPINEKHPAWDGETPARGLWSHDYRPLPYQTDKGAYLPVEGMSISALPSFTNSMN